ncbi:putative lipase esterase family protein [Phaeomoniella chlamydospora]|uniref:Putative lipase esterase family protein n=1 Tax=Phaeomoniella chlamydospora TaxID=158046 RepID=A0A0G2E3B7_PHACM|nr:putative lipase esterase family protein [Phaeomoniella chlamydospora]
MKFSIVLLLPFFGLASLSLAQFVTFTPSGSDFSDIEYKVNIPTSTADSGSGPIYISMQCPSDSVEWCGLGQGSQMSGANIFIMYAASSSNITISPRLGTGHTMPMFNSDAQITVLEGSGISNGIMTGNFRCDSCSSWSGGSMDLTSSSSDWIYAVKNGDAITSTDQSESISEHDGHGSATLDLTEATGGSSSNPFISSSSTSNSSSTSTSSSTSPSSISSTSSSGGVTSQSSSSTSTTQLKTAHAAVMTLAFLVFFPLGATLAWIPIPFLSNKIIYLHAPIQIISLLLVISGLGLGIKLAKNINDIDGYHQIIGYVVVASMVLIQPVFGILQHSYFKKHGGSSLWGISHRWFGRILLVLGIINGGLGAGLLAGDTMWLIRIYEIVPPIWFVLYVVGLVVVGTKQRKNKGQKVSSLTGEREKSPNSRLVENGV